MRETVPVQELREARAYRSSERTGEFVLHDALERLQHTLELRAIPQLPVDVPARLLEGPPEFSVDRVGRLFTEEALDRFEQLVVGLELIANRLFCHGALRVLPRMAWISIECHYAPPPAACLPAIRGAAPLCWGVSQHGVPGACRGTRILAPSVIGAGREGSGVTDEQSRAPYLERWLAYLDEGVVPFSTPGHKQGRGAPPEFTAAFGARALALDIPHDGGTYETHLAVDPLDEAERLAAALWGARDAVFLVNGSTTGNLAALLTLSQPGRPILVTRAMHKSLLAGLVLSGARPVYVVPELHSESGLLLDIAPEAVQRALDAHPDVTAVAIVSPTYTGVTSDIARLAMICHERGLPLFVDEAWGPHLPFHPALPAAAIPSGADLAVTSLHKLAGALTQTALLLVGGDLVDAARLRAAVAMVQTTSPAAFLYASLDATRRRLALEGERLLSRTLELAEQARHALARIPGLRVIGPEIVDGRSGAGFDCTRLVVDVQGIGLTGLEAKRRLRRDYGIAAEMADLVSVVCLLTVGDTPETIDALVRAFAALAAEQGTKPLSNTRELGALLRATGPIVAGAPQVLTPREAFFAPAERVPLACAAGRIAAEPITPYPPGIPVVAPGEAVRPEVVEFLRAGIAAGMRFNGASDPTLATIRVVRE